MTKPDHNPEVGLRGGGTPSARFRVSSQLPAVLGFMIVAAVVLQATFPAPSGDWAEGLAGKAVIAIGVVALVRWLVFGGVAMIDAQTRVIARVRPLGLGVAWCRSFDEITDVRTSRWPGRECMHLRFGRKRLAIETPRDSDWAALASLPRTTPD